MCTEVWAHIGSFLSSCNDVKNLSLVNKDLWLKSQPSLWHTIDLCHDSKSESELLWRDSVARLERFLRHMNSNNMVETNMRKLTVSSEYAVCTALVQSGYATEIFSRALGLTHLVVVQPRCVIANMDAFYSHRIIQPYIHRAEYCSFHTPSMVLRLPTGIRTLEGMFPSEETARAFLLVQSPSLRIWKENHRHNIPYFIEDGFITPPLSSIRISRTGHSYDRMRDSSVLQKSVRALQIGEIFDPQKIFPTMRSFTALETLAITVPEVGAQAHLAGIGINLPQIRHLQLCSNGFVCLYQSYRPNSTLISCFGGS